FSNAAMLVTPVVPTTATTAATCAADGLSTITNYNAAQTYVFTPTGPTVGAGGVITGMTAGISYTVKASNGSCLSGASIAFKNPEKLTTPVMTLTNGYVCVDPNSGAVLNTYTITANLSATDYSFQWTDSSGAIVGGSGNSYTASAPGTYTAIATPLTSAVCPPLPAQATVVPSSWPQALDVVTSEYFADVMSINVMATPAGNYEYSLDGGDYQSSSVFTDVTPGEHTVTVRDVHQCGDISITTTLIDFPRYFTPNGDGYHDTWNISALQGQSNSKIHIFDRFGKLLKEIRPSSSGWNGTFNGQDLPSTDYWF
ncbi:T9SS type B sorting domain-containing protein, partial [Flavobacterium hankyongi]